jgi:lipoprotein signal peptidase
MASCDASPTPRERFLYIVLPVLLMGLLVDQTSKSWASFRATEPRILVRGYLAAYSVRNAGCILGLGGDQAGTNTVFALLGIVSAILLVRIAYQDRRWWRGPDCLAAALLLAGIFGNTVDRLTLGHVRDFLITWAIPTLAFNVADVLAVAGAGLLFTTRYYAFRRIRSTPGFAHCPADLKSQIAC